MFERHYACAGTLRSALEDGRELKDVASVTGGEPTANGRVALATLRVKRRSRCCLHELARLPAGAHGTRGRH